MRFLPWARPQHSRQDTRRYLRGARLARARRRAFELLVEEAQSEAVLGITSLHRIDWPRRCAGVGYWIRASAWGKGFATEATRVMIEYAFHDLALHRLEAHIAAENRASLRVAEKLGFRREGIARESELVHAGYADHVQYSLLSSDRFELPGVSR